MELKTSANCCSYGHVLCVNEWICVCVCVYRCNSVVRPYEIVSFFLEIIQSQLVFILSCRPVLRYLQKRIQLQASLE